jgi:hypothetical protein
MDTYGYHALCCPGRSMFARHELLAWALYYAASDALIHPQWKAQVSCLGPSWHSTGRANSGVTSFRPADLLFPPPWAPKPTCIDATIISPVQAAVLELVKLLIVQNQIKLLNIYHHVSLLA